MQTAGLPIPKDWDDVTPAWTTAALAGHHPGAEVAEVRLLLRDDGTNRRARFGVTYTAGSGPATVFAKAADPAHTELAGTRCGCATGRPWPTGSRSGSPP
jgi:hypothetical protein